MVETLRHQLRDLIGQASHLDGLLAEADGLPALEAAKAVVELDRIGRRLNRCIVALEKVLLEPAGM